MSEQNSLHAFQRMIGEVARIIAATSTDLTVTVTSCNEGRDHTALVERDPHNPTLLAGGTIDRIRDTLGTVGPWTVNVTIDDPTVRTIHGVSLGTIPDDVWDSHPSRRWTQVRDRSMFGGEVDLDVSRVNGRVQIGIGNLHLGSVGFTGADRLAPLSDEQVEQVASIIRYMVKTHLGIDGEQVDIRLHRADDVDMSLLVEFAMHDSVRSDPHTHLRALLWALRDAVMLREGTPVRRTNRQGPIGSRCVEGVGPRLAAPRVLFRGLPG